MTRRQEISQTISDARQAQLKARGGYTTIERDARAHERQIDREAVLAPQEAKRLEGRVQELEKERRFLRQLIAESSDTDCASCADLRRRLKLKTSALSATRKRRDYWYTHATGHQPTEGRGAARLRSVA